jgi:hypothetical protein
MNIDLTPFYNQALALIIPALVSAIGGFLVWALNAARRWMEAESAKLQKQGFNADILSAIDFAVEVAKRGGSDLNDPETRTHVAAVAENYLQQAIPGKLKTLKVNQQWLANIITARFNSPSSAIPALPSAPQPDTVPPQPWVGAPKSEPPAQP